MSTTSLGDSQANAFHHVDAEEKNETWGLSDLPKGI